MEEEAGSGKLEEESEEIIVLVSPVCASSLKAAKELREWARER